MIARARFTIAHPTIRFYAASPCLGMMMVSDGSDRGARYLSAFGKAAMAGPSAVLIGR